MSAGHSNLDQYLTVYFLPSRQAADEDMRIIFQGLERALAAGESEKVFFKFLKSEGFVPTAREKESQSRLKNLLHLKKDR